MGDFEYRAWLVARMEGEVGPLYGEGKGIYSLDTESLEALYKQLLGKNPVAAYRYWMTEG